MAAEGISHLVESSVVGCRCRREAAAAASNCLNGSELKEREEEEEEEEEVVGMVIDSKTDSAGADVSSEQVWWFALSSFSEDSFVWFLPRIFPDISTEFGFDGFREDAEDCNGRVAVCRTGTAATNQLILTKKRKWRTDSR